MIKIVYMGTPEFAVPPLRLLVENGYHIPFVVTMPDRPTGRGKKISPPPVKQEAMSHGIPAIQPKSKEDLPLLFKELKEVEPDLIIVAAYGMILPKEILELPALGCINIHASLLPRHRGASPIQNAILEGDIETGVSLMYMSEGMDEGDVISISKTEIGDKTTGDLFIELSQMGGDLLIRTLPDIIKKEAGRMPQDSSKASYSKKIKKSDSQIDFSKSAEEISRHIRAMTPFPGARTVYKEKPLIITKAKALNEEDKNPADKSQVGTVEAVDDNGIKLTTSDGKLLITDLKPAGKQSMKVSEYIKGNKIEIGEVLG